MDKIPSRLIILFSRILSDYYTRPTIESLFEFTDGFSYESSKEKLALKLFKIVNEEDPQPLDVFGK